MPHAATNLPLAVDIGSFECPSVWSLRRIDSDKIWRRSTASRSETQHHTRCDQAKVAHAHSRSRRRPGEAAARQPATFEV